MNRVVFAAVADDDTGASDLAGMLAEQGLRTLLVIDLPTADRFAEWSEGYDGVIMAEATRNLAPAVARQRTAAAIRLVEPRQPRVFQVKYCSTFDSTNEGNIGPSIDAAMDELGEEFTAALPALPVNGRTTYMGYHFVHDRLLSDSSMRNHPLTPMTNPNLVDLLGAQTKRKVGLAPYAQVRAGARHLREFFEEIRRQGVGIAVTDCLNDEHVEIISRAAADLRLITGSSAFCTKLPSIWRERGWLAPRGEERFPIPEAGGGGCLLVAGSCSVATREQNEWIVARGVKAINIDPKALLGDGLDRSALIAEARREIVAGRHCLLTTSTTPDEVHNSQEWGKRRGLTVPELGEAIATEVAGLAFDMIEECPVAGLISAGGETSGALCRHLGLGALRVGRNIEPGVPLCFSLGRLRLPVVLKSGNFGSKDFYARALQAIAGCKA